MIDRLPETGLTAAELTEVLGLPSVAASGGYGASEPVDVVFSTLRAHGVVDDPEHELLQEMSGDIVAMVGRELGGAPNPVTNAVTNPGANPAPGSASASVLVPGAVVAGRLGAAEHVVLVAREQARRRGVSVPAMVVSSTADPVFHIAAQRLGVETVSVPANDSGRFDLEALEYVCDTNTALIVASVPSRILGVVDPVVPLAEVAGNLGALFHVDAGIGGWTLPFLSDGDPVPFDLGVEGVSSMAVHLDHVGPGIPLLSAVLYRDQTLANSASYLDDAGPGPAVKFPVGIAAIAPYAVTSAWATLLGLGRVGATRRASTIAGWSSEVRFGLSQVLAVDQASVFGDPGMAVIGVCDERHDMAGVATSLLGSGHQAVGRAEMLSLYAPLHDAAAAPLVEQLRGVLGGD